jgi:hypothetical protein
MSATGTAIQVQRVRPGGAILICAALVATLGVGFFVGRVSEPKASTAPAAIAAVPELGWDSDGAAVRSQINEKTLGDAAVSGVGSATAVMTPHVPKRADATQATSDRVASNHYLPKKWHL